MAAFAYTKDFELKLKRKGDQSLGSLRFNSKNKPKTTNQTMK